MTRRAAIYCRISRDRVGAGLGVERQEADCRELADRLGWTVAAVHTDNDISAYSGKVRPGYRALLADVEAGRADAVIAWHNDRLHRSMVELEDYAKVCATLPTHFVRSGPLDLSTASGLMTARILGAVARQEVDHMIERQRSAKAQAARDGRYRGGARAFGYAADGVTVVPEEAALVADASRRVLRGESLSALAREWTAGDVLSAAWHPPMVPTVWTSVAVRRILLRARNAALIEVDGEELPATWPPLVDEETWRAVRWLCAKPDRRTATSVDPVRLGAGVYRCGVCDTATTMRSGTTSGGHPGYRCRAKDHLAVKAEPIDALISELVLTRLARPDAAQLLTRRDGAPDTAGLADEAAALRVRLDELATLFAAGAVTGGQLATGTADIRRRLAEVETVMASSAAGSPLAGIADAPDVVGAWEAASVSRRKAVVGALMDVVICSPGKGARAFDPASIRVEWRHG